MRVIFFIDGNEHVEREFNWTLPRRGEAIAFGGDPQRFVIERVTWIEEHRANGGGHVEIELRRDAP